MTMRPTIDASTEPIGEQAATEFEAVKHANNIALLAVTFDGEPTTAIVAINTDDGEFIVTPMYVRLTEKMLDQVRNPFGEEPTDTNKRTPLLALLSTDDPTHNKAHDAVQYGHADRAEVRTADGHLLFEAHRVSDTSYAWRTAAMGTHAYGLLSVASKDGGK